MRAKWRSSLSACHGVLEKGLTPPTLSERRCFNSYRKVRSGAHRFPAIPAQESGDYPGSMSAVGSGRLAAEKQIIEGILADGSAEFLKGTKRDQHYEDHEPD